MLHVEEKPDTRSEPRPPDLYCTSLQALSLTELNNPISTPSQQLTQQHLRYLSHCNNSVHLYSDLAPNSLLSLAFSCHFHIASDTQMQSSAMSNKCLLYTSPQIPGYMLTWLTRVGAVEGRWPSCIRKCYMQ